MYFFFDLDGMKKFYVDILGIPLVQIEKGKLVFQQAGKSMLLIINLGKTSTDNDRLRMHGAQTPRHASTLQWRIEAREYPLWKELLAKNKITIEKEVNWKDRNKSLYFRDPVANLVKLITPARGRWKANITFLAVLSDGQESNIVAKRAA